MTQLSLFLSLSLCAARQAVRCVDPRLDCGNHGLLVYPFGESPKSACAHGE